ncbi:hypothetical protein LTR37_010959 [Vermiconidia calcicola]|uniref:Uncharacterized protein n=1 Tax=Vermiconidia calcicola TaxID=1690605 RepID=A0ACC3N3Y3_9PEZI|nr:hypothetical protein LTR37_010959 [Vermiconidia calcicola]
MLKKFDDKKREILGRLSRTDAEYTDASPKGSIDDGIRELVRDINSIPGFITTSSCAGRVAVFLEGAQKQSTARGPGVEDEEVQSGDAGQAIAASWGGKGGGRWLFTSHTPVDLEKLSNEGALSRHLGFSSTLQVSSPPLNLRPQFVHLKFEPMIMAHLSIETQILHILTSSTEQAQAVLNAAMTAGFRESGITGLLDNKGRPSTPMVAVRSSGLALDSIVGFQCDDPSTPWANQITPMVSESYLRTLVHVSNERFQMNEVRKQRFREAFLERVGFRDMPLEDSNFRDYKPRSAYEPAAVRRERKRREGLARKEKMLAFAGALDGAHGTDGNAEEVEGDSDDLGLFMLGNDGTSIEDSSIEPNQKVDFGYVLWTYFNPRSCTEP